MRPQRQRYYFEPSRQSLLDESKRSQSFRSVWSCQRFGCFDSNLAELGVPGATSRRWTLDISLHNFEFTQNSTAASKQSQQCVNPPISSASAAAAPVAPRASEGATSGLATLFFVLGAAIALLCVALRRRVVNQYRSRAADFLEKLEKQANAWLRSGERDAAIADLNKHLPLAISLRGEGHEQTARLKHILAKAYLQQGSTTLAEVLLGSVRSCYEACGNDAALANCLEDLGGCFHAQRLLDRALDSYLSALDLWIMLHRFHAVTDGADHASINGTVNIPLSSPYNEAKALVRSSAAVNVEACVAMASRVLLTADNSSPDSTKAVGFDVSVTATSESPCNADRVTQDALASAMAFEHQFASPAKSSGNQRIGSPDCGPGTGTSEPVMMDAIQVPASAPAARLHILIANVLADQGRPASAKAYLRVATEMFAELRTSAGQAVLRFTVGAGSGKTPKAVDNGNGSLDLDAALMECAEMLRVSEALLAVTTTSNDSATVPVGVSSAMLLASLRRHDDDSVSESESSFGSEYDGEGDGESVFSDSEDDSVNISNFEDGSDTDMEVEMPEAFKATN